LALVVECAISAILLPSKTPSPPVERLKSICIHFDWMLDVRILALDPAEYKVGFARGESGSKPAVSVYKLRNKGERTEDAVARFAVWLHEQLKTHEIELLTVEHFLPAGALKGSTTADTLEGQVGLGYAARAVAAVCKVHFRSPPPQTVRVHFCGQAFGTALPGQSSRDATKSMVIKQAKLLGYIPPNCEEDNMADAAALFDFSSSTYARKATVFRLTEKA
jgi:hypothetical protein